MLDIPNILLVLKYITAGLILFIIVMTPAYLARVTKKKKYDMLLVRLSSWLFGWTGIGWLYALFLAVKK